MKILIVSQQFYPEEFKINEIVKELVKKGHKVTVLTGLPNYPSGVIPKEYKFFRNRKHDYYGAKVIRSMEIARKNNTIGLSLNYLSFMISSLFKSIFMKKDFDVIYVYQLTPVTMCIPAIIIKKIKNIKLFIYCLDLWPESLKTTISEKSFIYNIMKKISAWIYTKADKVGVTSKAFLEYFTNYHKINKNKLVYLPQHSEEIKDDIGFLDNGIVDFVFTGNIGKAQGVEVFIKAASKLKDYNFKIHIVGEGSDLENVKKTSSDLNMDERVIFYGRKPASEMNEFYKLADVCLLCLKTDSFIGDTLPAKLQGYMSAGKPVLAAAGISSKEVIQDADCGIAVDFFDVDLLTKAMDEMCNLSMESLIKMGQNAKVYADYNFNIDNVINKLEKQLEILTQDKE